MDFFGLWSFKQKLILDKFLVPVIGELFNYWWPLNYMEIGEKGWSILDLLGLLQVFFVMQFNLTNTPSTLFSTNE